MRFIEVMVGESARATSRALRTSIRFRSSIAQEVSHRKSLSLVTAESASGEIDGPDVSVIYVDFIQ